MTAASGSKRRVVIIGGGFGGINVAKTLGGNPHCEITIIDRRNHHLFQPLLYQVAMAGLDPSDVASPIRSMLNRYQNVTTLLGEVTDVDVERQVIHSSVGDLPYDWLIVACGATHDYFGHDDWEDHAPGLKTIPQATEIRRRVLLAFEAAERTKDPQERSRWLTFVLIGGGPTGVELAGAIAEMAKTTLKRDFRSIDASHARVILVQGGDRILEQFPEDLSSYGKSALETLGVEVRLGQLVTEVNGQGAKLGDQFIDAGTVIWAAGVRANPIGATLGANLDRAGRVQVKDDLTISDHPEVFVIGDLACAMDGEGQPLPGLAPVAIQQGRYVGRLIQHELESKESPERAPFRYLDKGQMATIGRRRAVLQSGRVQLKGTLAWMGWLFVHIAYLNGFRNRFFVFLSWAWSYVTFARGARLIVSKQWKLKKDPP